MKKVLANVVVLEIVAFMAFAVLGALSWLATVVVSWIVDAGNFFFGNLVVGLLVLMVAALAINKTTQKAAGCTLFVLIGTLVLVYGGAFFRVILGFSTNFFWAPFNSIWALIGFVAIFALIGAAWALGEEPSATVTNPEAVGSEPEAK